MIEWLWPWCALLLPLPWLVARWLPPVQHQDAALRVPALDMLLPASPPSVTPTRPRWVTMLLWAGWMLLVTALCRPQWTDDAVGLPASGRDLLLVVDLSGSMNEADMAFQGRCLTRVEVVKEVVADFVARRVGDRVGLIVFGDQAFLHAPLTFDRHTVGELLAEATPDMAGGRTAIGDAIGLAVKTLRERPGSRRVAILLTDGAQNIGQLTPAMAASLAAQHAVTVHTIGFGAEAQCERSFFGLRSNPSAGLDEATLKAVANATGGRYFRARDPQELLGIYQVLDAIEPVEQDPRMVRPVKALYHWPLAGALAAGLALALRTAVAAGALRRVAHG